MQEARPAGRSTLARGGPSFGRGERPLPPSEPECALARGQQRPPVLTLPPRAGGPAQCDAALSRAAGLVDSGHRELVLLSQRRGD
jgi:hypothetical protein